MTKEEGDAITDRVIGDVDVAAAVEKAGGIMRRSGAVASLDRLSCRFYEALVDAVDESPDLADLVQEIDSPDTIAMVIGWMLGHPGSAPNDPADRQFNATRALLLAAVAAGWSVEMNHRALKRQVN